MIINAKELYGLRLGEFATPNDNTMLLRVPGGWVYSGTMGTCFVPYDNEFQPKD